MQVQDAASLLKFAGFVTFVCFAVYGGIQVEELTDADRIEDDTTLAYSLRFLGEALTYGGVLYGLGWAISLLNSLKGKGGTHISGQSDSGTDMDEL